MALQSDEDSARLQSTLGEILRLDPLLEVRPALDPAAIVLAGQSESQLHSICARLRYEFHIEIDVSAPQVLYLETILKTAEAEGKYIRQTGGSGNYGHVKIRLEPRDSGAGIDFINGIRGGVIPDQFIPSIEQGIREAARCGILTGREVVAFKATLFDGSYHEMDSNPAAFVMAAAQAFKEAAKKADPSVIEPIMTTVFTARESALSDKLAEISTLRGRVEEMATNQGTVVVRALVPLREMLGYHGPAAQVMSFSHYVLANWPPDSDAANASVRNPSGPGPKPRAEAASVDPDFDWT